MLRIHPPVIVVSKFKTFWSLCLRIHHFLSQITPHKLFLSIFYCLFKSVFLSVAYYLNKIIIMKKQTNVEIIQQAYADFLAGNIAAVADQCTDDVKWGNYDNPLVPYAGMFHGKQGVKDFFARLANAVDYSEFSPKEFSSDETKDVVFVRGHHTGKVKSTGKTFSHDWLMEFYLREGKVRSFFAFVDSFDQSQAFVADKENVVRVSLGDETVAHA
jgi:ketosteroid isomerase-like protein